MQEQLDGLLSRPDTPFPTEEEGRADFERQLNKIQKATESENGGEDEARVLRDVVAIPGTKHSTERWRKQ
jgi:hypothetical protein